MQVTAVSQAWFQKADYNLWLSKNGQIVPLVTKLTGEAGAQNRASLVATQILGLAYCRYILNLGDDYLDPPDTVAAIAETLQRYLFAPAR